MRQKIKVSPEHTKSLPTPASKQGRSLKHNKQIGEKINTSGHGGGRKDFRRERESRTNSAKDEFITAALLPLLGQRHSLEGGVSAETKLLEL